MNGTPMTNVAGSFEPRRTLYRRSRRVLVGLLVGRLHGCRPALERATRGFLRDRPRRYLARVVADRRFAMAAAAALVASATATALPPVSLADVAAGNGGFIMNGIDAFDFSGHSVSGAGDVNGDGLADLIVGARYADPGGSGTAGESYVVFGKAATTPVSLADVAAGTGGFVINGSAPLNRSGWSVSSAGDVNGDGLDDLIVGAPRANPGANFSAGESYVVFGKADTTPVSLADVAAGIGGFIMNGIDAYDYSGRSVSGAGDVNGDGLADLIVGARDAGAIGQGESYVVFGKADTTPVSLADVVAGTGGFIINGANQADQSGASVSGAGDVNGDGLADLIVGAPFADAYSRGESYVVFGKADTAPVNLVNLVADTGGFRIIGANQGDRLGWYVSGAGDVNGDGLADLIVGVPNVDQGSNTNEGESYVVFGKTDTVAVFLSNVVAGTGGFVIRGIDPGDKSGRVSGAGDVNGDGLADLIVGAAEADPGGNGSAGESYVVFGKADTMPVSLADVVAGTGGFVINGIDPADRSGGSVSAAGDVNGDGLADLIVGARFADPGGNSLAGESYVVFGPLPCPWDCGDGDGQVGIVDFLAMLAQWGGPGSCDSDDGGVGITDFLALLGNWGPCP